MAANNVSECWFASIADAADLIVIKLSLHLAKAFFFSPKCPPCAMYGFWKFFSLFFRLDLVILFLKLGFSNDLNLILMLIKDICVQEPQPAASRQDQNWITAHKIYFLSFFFFLIHFGVMTSI